MPDKTVQFEGGCSTPYGTHAAQHDLSGGASNGSDPAKQKAPLHDRCIAKVGLIGRLSQRARLLSMENIEPFAGSVETGNTANCPSENL
jgi:hypothetical protein